VFYEGNRCRFPVLARIKAPGNGNGRYIQFSLYLTKQSGTLSTD